MLWDFPVHPHCQSPIQHSPVPAGPAPTIFLPELLGQFQIQIQNPPLARAPAKGRVGAEPYLGSASGAGPQPGARRSALPAAGLTPGGGLPTNPARPGLAGSGLVTAWHTPVPRAQRAIGTAGHPSLDAAPGKETPPHSPVSTAAVTSRGLQGWSSGTAGGVLGALRCWVPRGAVSPCFL